MIKWQLSFIFVKLAAFELRSDFLTCLTVAIQFYFSRRVFHFFDRLLSLSLSYPIYSKPNSLFLWYSFLSHFDLSAFLDSFLTSLTLSLSSFSIDELEAIKISKSKFKILEIKLMFCGIQN